MTFERGANGELALEGMIDIGFAGVCYFTGEKLTVDVHCEAVNIKQVWESRKAA